MPIYCCSRFVVACEEAEKTLTVFDLISGLFAYVILGQNNRPN